MRKLVIQISSLQRANGFDFGTPPETIINQLGLPDETLENYTGELELRYGECFYRFAGQQMVECTFPDAYQFVVNNVEILSMFRWLGSQPDHVDIAHFRISPGLGIAYDHRLIPAPPDSSDAAQAADSVTVFTAGYWDALLENQS
ncbi:MAG: hypothetical protein AAF993_13175 [Pseudomonadota bacterium]